jgi:hypothetical protein
VKRTRLLLTAMLAVVAAPAAAQAPAAPDLFDSFRTVCGDHRANYDRTTAAAAAKGWKAFPLPIPIPFKDGKLRRKSVRFQEVAGGHLMFFAGQGEFAAKGGPAPFEMCAVAIEPAALAAAVRPLEAWAGAPAERSADGKLSVRFHEAGGKRQPLPAGKLKELAKTLGPGTLISIDGVPNKGGAVLTYTVVKL